MLTQQEEALFAAMEDSSRAGESARQHARSERGTFVTEEGKDLLTQRGKPLG